jgi:MiaB-like tRNA modifying enzyme
LDSIKKINPQANFALISVKKITQIKEAINALIKEKDVILVDKENKFFKRKIDKREIKLNYPKENINRIIGITQISEGCIGNCAYCAVKLAKGNLYSYSLEEIIRNIQLDLKKGSKEIWLTSQDNAIYGLDTPNREYQLPLLLSQVLELKNRFYLRLGMMNPSSLKNILEEVLKFYKDKKMFKFIHIPIQSGSNKILKLMHRPYNSLDFIKIVDKIRTNFPEMTISTDIIVGFPGETDKDFQETLNLIKATRPNIVNVSRFWAMKGTEAFKLREKNSVSIEVVSKRIKKLKEICDQIALENNKPYIGKEFEILIDEKSKRGNLIGRTENYKQVLLPLSERKIKIGDKIKVKIVNAAKGDLKGVVI